MIIVIDKACLKNWYEKIGDHIIINQIFEEYIIQILIISCGE